MSEPNNIDPKAVKVLNEFAKNKLPNNLEWLKELQNQVQEFCEEYSIVEEGNGRDYMNKWFNRNYDRIELAITSKINEIETQARIDELLRLTRFKMIKTNTGTTEQRVVERLKELRKSKEEVLR